MACVCSTCTPRNMHKDLLLRRRVDGEEECGESSDGRSWFETLCTELVISVAVAVVLSSVDSMPQPPFLSAYVLLVKFCVRRP